MRTSSHSDSFIVINGPEDGAVFPITRSPFRIGDDPSCAVSLRLDADVKQFHADASVVSDGYRIRQAGSAPIYVNGKRAGRLLSRVVHRGGTVQLGQTLLAVECASDGLAHRSHGVVSESDLGWIVRQLAQHAFGATQGILGFLLSRLFRLMTRWWVVLGILIFLYFTWPAFHRWAYGLLSHFYYWLNNHIYSGTGRSLPNLFPLRMR